MDNPKFSIISNNCWGGHVYRYFGLPYDSPTVGLYFYSDEYIRLLSDLESYMDMELEFIPFTESRYYEDMKRKQEKVHPVGLLGDVEIEFLHYKSEEEARNKWNRRCARMHWDNLYIKFSEQNLCSMENLNLFEGLTYAYKFVFTSADYGLGSQIVFKEYQGLGEVKNDALHFRKYINLIKWINGQADFRRL